MSCHRDHLQSTKALYEPGLLLRLLTFDAAFKVPEHCLVELSLVLLIDSVAFVVVRRCIRNPPVTHLNRGRRCIQPVQECRSTLQSSHDVQACRRHLSR